MDSNVERRKVVYRLDRIDAVREWFELKFNTVVG